MMILFALVCLAVFAVVLLLALAKVSDRKSVV